MLALNLIPRHRLSRGDGGTGCRADRRRYRLRRHHLSGRRLAVPEQLTAELAGVIRADCRALRLSRRNAQRGGRWLAAQSAALSSGGGSGERPPHHWFCATPNCRSTRLAARSAIFPPPRGLPPCARCCATTAPDATESAKSAALHGASYHRGKTDTTFSEEDQQHNRQRLIDRFPARSGHRTWISAPTTLAAACAAPPAIIYRWSATCRTTRQH